jgi:transposase
MVNLQTNRVIYIGDSKGTNALDKFWLKVQQEAVTTDLSPAFISSVMTNAPDATLVFDHFHVVKLMNDALDEILRSLYRQERDLNKRKVIKGTRWLLLCNGKDIDDENFKSRLEDALKLNEPLMTVYYGINPDSCGFFLCINIS